MSIIAPGTPAPEFVLQDEDGEDFTQESLKGQTTILVFYPFAFSPVCTDQLQIYEKVPAGDLRQGRPRPGRLHGPVLLAEGVQGEAGRQHRQLSDFEPKGRRRTSLRRLLRPGRHDGPAPSS